MAFYFRNFPLVKYSFGDGEPRVYFQKLSAMIDMIDQIKQETAYYTKHTIADFERPDTLSYLLYKTTDYYWTFFLMNDHLRESGWPVDVDRIDELMKERYPYYTLSTTDFVSTRFLVGEEVKCTPTGEYVTIIRKKLDLGQIIVKPTGFVQDPEAQGNDIVKITSFQTDENIKEATGLFYKDADGIDQQISVYKSVNEYSAAHHYEDANSEWADVNPFSQDRTGLTLFTVEEVFKNKNKELKEIDIIRPNVANKIVGEFQKLIRS